ncbi:MAG: DUF1192 family protein [Rhodospirillaceae bacterium]|nr:DUF1192 family protein [Rhodospirillaceae bacterium]
MMEMDDDILRSLAPLQLESFSVKELEEYIKKLQERILLVQNLIAKKQRHHQTVDKLFK